MTPDELDRLWSAVARPAGGLLNGRRTAGPAPVLAALDERGHRHLLVQVPPGTALPRLTPTRGLDVAVDQMDVAGESAATWIDITCAEPALVPTFTAAAAAIDTAVNARPGEPAVAVVETLRTWRWFWTVDPTGLGAEAALGLFAELWFLERWLGLPHGVDAWAGPSGNRHDFVTASSSIEVKATRTRSDGPATHRIANLDQLDDPEAGQLWLFSLQVVSDDLATNSLTGSIQRISATLAAHPDVLLEFNRRLATAGWSPVDTDRHRSGLRILTEELYEVGPGFPRLTRHTFPHGPPAGVTDISYSIDLAACAPWRRRTAPGHLFP